MKLKKGILLLLIAVCAFSGCGQKSKAGAGVIDVPVFAVNTILAVQGQIQNYLSFSGDIVAGSTVDAYSDAVGKVTEIYVSVGNRVNKGDRIAAVDPSRPGMTFRQSVATAPISGTIIMIPAQVGMTVSQAVPLARITGGGGYEIKLSVAERFISRMAMNLPCEVTLDAWPGEIFNGSISEISPTVDLASRTMEVRVNVTDTRGRLKPGMFAKVRVVTERKNNIVKIPASAVINRFGEQYVYVVEKLEEEIKEDTQEEVKEEKKNIFAKIKDKSKKKDAEETSEGEEVIKKTEENYIVRKRIITPGILIDGVIEITNGLSPNEEIVVRGQTLLDDGSRVNVIERVTPLKEQL
ncbi:MAG: efflux RND transporter periplasmic adaptor subunit [Treponema sp.]|nr:efflux RND transporter periplasmic adaptor subunit [Treponema sp.]